ncbi:uncharacterized protein LOC126847121 isoform X2 [Adelges cooleyi]|uniref:uncharacterized protein LOC126847121 isoform X2 n=1 Tax=Adelges cooleyi TaxID=133065 RepID=UPI00217F4FD9|nr:uncharacterized protein LOC126847121 isoform X2 [Adelges cooleyi]
METYFLYNGNLGTQDSVIDSDDIFVIEQPFESYQNDDHQRDQTENKTVLPESRIRTWREWSQFETKILMDMYRRNSTQVGPTKKFKSKKEMFGFIAQSLSERLNITRSAHQCENRYKTVVNQRKSGYFDRVLLGKKTTNTPKILDENEKSLNAATASVSADHDYNGLNITKFISNEWGVEDTRLLMDLYKKNISKVGLHRTFRTKLKMFEFISKSLSDMLHITRSAEQCINRYKTIMRRKHIKLDIATSIDEFKEENSNSSFQIPNLNSLCDIKLIDDSGEYEQNSHLEAKQMYRNVIKKTGTPPKCQFEELETRQETELTRTLKEIADQKEKTLLKIAANREVAEERRHQETMALIRQLGENILRCIGNPTFDTSEHHY